MTTKSVPIQIDIEQVYNWLVEGKVKLEWCEKKKAPVESPKVSVSVAEKIPASKTKTAKKSKLSDHVNLWLGKWNQDKSDLSDVLKSLGKEYTSIWEQIQKGKTQKQVADSMGRSLATVRNRLVKITEEFSSVVPVS